MQLTERFNYPESYDVASKHALERALNTAQAYAPWRELDPGPSAPINDRYAAMPALDKQMIRDHFPTGLVPDHKDVQEGLLTEAIQYTFTSGTTGDRVINIWDQDWWDRAEQSAWQLNAHLARLSYPQIEAKLASSLNVGISCEEDLPMSSRIVGHRLYLNEKINLVQWMPRHYIRMANELQLFQPIIIEANPTLLARLAFWAMDNGVQMHQPAAIVYSYEFPSIIHRRAIAEVFAAPQISSYGTTETGFVLQECECGLLHQNLDFCRIDFEPLVDKFGGPDLGRILVSTFQNPWNAVIRFDVGDLVRLHTSSECRCGRGEGMIATAIEGRVGNVTFTTEGGLVTTQALDQALAQIEGIRDYHLDQESPTDYHLELMAKGETAAIEGATRQTLRDLYGADGSFDIQFTDNLLPGQAGKFRRSQANFDFDERGLFA